MGKSGGRFSAVLSRLSERRRALTTHGLCLTIYDRLLHRFPGLPLPARRAVVGVPIHATNERVFARLGTTDLLVVEEIFIHGEYAAVINAVGRNCRLIVDLGSNVGVSLVLWRSTWPEARIVAVEPDEANMRMCAMNAPNLAHANGQSVSFVQACAAGTPGEVRLDRSGGEWGFKIAEEASRSTFTDKPCTVPALTMPQILEQAAVAADTPIDLLKCDIEGAERGLFETCAPWIGRVRIAVVELHGDYTIEQLEQDIVTAGHRFTISTLKKLDSVSLIMLVRSQD